MAKRAAAISTILSAVASVTKAHYIAILSVMGFLPFEVNLQSNAFKLTRRTTLYSLCFGSFTLIYYGYASLVVYRGKSSAFFAIGVGAVTAELANSAGFVLIITYFFGFWNRQRTVNYFNRHQRNHSKYGLFYSGNYNLSTLFTWQTLDLSDDEMVEVCLGMFSKSVIIPTMNLITFIARSIRTYRTNGTPIYALLPFITLPYLIISVQSSLVYLIGKQTQYLLIKLNRKLEHLKMEVRSIAASATSKYEKMSGYCRCSDEIDKLSRCYGDVNGMCLEINELFGYQTVAIIIYLITNTLHELFAHYRMVSHAISPTTQTDAIMITFSMASIILNVYEFTMVIGMIEENHAASARVGKSLHKISYFHPGLDKRLEQSVSFSYQFGWRLEFL